MLTFLVTAAALVSTATAAPDPITAGMTTDIQAFLDNVSAVTGFGFSVGYVDGTRSFGLGSGPRSPPGLPAVAAAGNVSATDTMLLGSGTKPFTAAAVMRLVDAKKVKLGDSLAMHIDAPLKALTGNGRKMGFVEMFGPIGASVTVGDVIGMRSGVGDFDIPGFDNEVLSDDVVSPPFRVRDLY
jgi:CubicO group peptidase (beta-lactamase class C family)